MKKLVLLFFVLLTFVSCNKEIEKPKDLISRQGMTSLLKDIYLYHQLKSSSLKKGEGLAEIDLAILKKHNVSLEQFKTSFKYYLIDGASYDEMLNEVKLSIEADLPKDTILKEKEEIGISKDIIEKGVSKKKPTPSKK